MFKALDHPDSYRIIDRQHNDGNGVGRFGCRDCGRHVRRDDNIDLATGQVGHQTVIFGIQDCVTVLDQDVLALNVAKVRQSLLEDHKPFWIDILGGHIAHHGHRLSDAVANMRRHQQR